MPEWSERMVMFPEETKAIIECLLFVAKEPLNLKNLSEILELPSAEVKEIVEELKSDYASAKKGMIIKEIARGYQLCTRPEFAPYIEKLYKPQGSYGLSNAALETLAIIAYKQPITRGEIEFLRGVKVDRAVTSLMEKNLIKEAGRKEGPGRPVLFGTTDEFLKYFGLRDLKDLPNPADFISQNNSQDQLGLEEG